MRVSCLSTRFPFLLAALLPGELLCLSAASVTLVLYSATGLNLRSPLELYIDRLRESLLLYLVALIVLPLIYRLQHLIRGWQRHRHYQRVDTYCVVKRRLRIRRLLLDLRLVNTIALTFTLFIQLKHLTPYLTDRLYDDTFLWLEKTLFFGAISPSLLQQYIPLEYAWMLSSAYTSFYPFMALLLMLVLISSNSRFAQQTLFRFQMLWFVGCLLIWLVPTLGPCFYLRESVAALPVTDVTVLQQGLWNSWLALQRSEESPAIFLISGFPSLHCAVPLFASFIFWKRHRLVATSMFIFAFLTAVSTLYFAWHYLLDDLASVPLAWGLARSSIRKSPNRITD